MNDQNNNELDKKILLKQLELEKIKLEIANREESKLNEMSYPNFIPWNLFLLLVIAGAFFLPWGNLDGDVRTSGYGSSISLSSRFASSGFQLGLLSFTYPFIFVWVLALIMTLCNWVRAMGFIALIGVFLSIGILFVVQNMGHAEASQYAAGYSVKASVGFKASPLCFIPLIGFMLLLFNFFVSKVSKVDNSLVWAEQRKERLMELNITTKHKNKMHAYDRPRLKKMLTAESILTLVTVTLLMIVADTRNHYFATYFISDKIIPGAAFVIFIIALALTLNEFLQHTLIKSLYYLFLWKFVLVGVFFIAQVFLMLNSNASMSIQNYSIFDVFVHSLPIVCLFVSTGGMLYLYLREMECVSLNYHKIGGVNEVS